MLCTRFPLKFQKKSIEISIKYSKIIGKLSKKAMKFKRYKHIFKVHKVKYNINRL